MASTPRSAKTRGKKVMWEDLVETQGSVSLPNTPTSRASRTQFSRELGLSSQENNEKRSNGQENSEKRSNGQENSEKRSNGQESNEKRSIIGKMQDKMKKWKQGSPSFNKRKPRSSNLGKEMSKSVSLSSRVSNGEGEFEEENPEFHGAPMYQSERAPDIYKQYSMDLKSVMRSPPHLNRCKSQRSRPGLKSEIEEIADMNRTKSDPLQLKTTESEMKEICDVQRTKSDPVQLNKNKSLPRQSVECSNDERYKSMVEEISEFLEPASDTISKATQEQVDLDELRKKPKPFRSNPMNFSPQLVHCETDETGTSNNPISPREPQMVDHAYVNDNDSNENKKPVEFVKEEESPTSKVLSEATLMIADSALTEIKPESYQLNQAKNLSVPIEACKPITEKFSTSFVDTCTSSSESNATNVNDKTVSQAVSEILTPAFNVVPKAADELSEANLLDNIMACNDTNTTNASDKMVSEAIGETLVPVFPEEIGELIETHLLGNSIASSDSNMSNASDKTVSEEINEISAPAFNVVVETTDEIIVANYQTLISKDELQKPELATLNVDEPVDLAPISTEVADSTNHDGSKTERVGLNENLVSKENDTIIEPTVNLAESDKSASALVELDKSVSSKNVPTNVTDDKTVHENNSTNHDGHKTETDQTVTLGDNPIPAQFETKVVLSKEPNENQKYDNNDTKDDADYKTVIDAVGEIISPVYDKISNLTNKVTEAGFSHSVSLRDYLKSKRVVVDQVRDRVSSLMKQDYELPISSNPHAEEVAVEESEVEGRRPQAN